MREYDPNEVVNALNNKDACIESLRSQRDEAQRSLTETMDRLRPTVDLIDERHVWERWEKARDAR